MTNSEADHSAGGREEPAVQTTNTARLWVALFFGILALVVVLVFILENLQRTRVSFFTAHWDTPLGVDLLFAALLGGFVVFVASAARIFQLRRVARRHHHALQQVQSELDDRGR